MPAIAKWIGPKLERLRALAEDGLSVPEMQRVLNEPYDSIRSALRYNNIPFARKTISWESVLPAVRAVIENGQSVPRVARDLGINPLTLQSVLQQWWIKRDSDLRRHKAEEELRQANAARWRRNFTSEYVAKRDPLIAQIESMVPTQLPHFLREDVIQDVVIQVLEGQSLSQDLVRACMKRNLKTNFMHEVSLDAPVAGDPEGRKLHEYVDSRTKTIFHDFREEDLDEFQQED